LRPCREFFPLTLLFRVTNVIQKIQGLSLPVFLYRDHLAPRTLSIKTKKKGCDAYRKKKEEGGNLIGKDSLSASNFSCTPLLSFSYSQPILTKDLHDQKRLGVEAVLRLVFSVNYKQGTETSKREARLRAEPS
jgi:hypothetical protein